MMKEEIAQGRPARDMPVVVPLLPLVAMENNVRHGDTPLFSLYIGFSIEVKNTCKDKTKDAHILPYIYLSHMFSVKRD